METRTIVSQLESFVKTKNEAFSKKAWGPESDKVDTQIQQWLVDNNVTIPHALQIADALIVLGTPGHLDVALQIRRNSVGLKPYIK